MQLKPATQLEAAEVQQQEALEAALTLASQLEAVAENLVTKLSSPPPPPPPHETQADPLFDAVSPGTTLAMRAALLVVFVVACLVATCIVVGKRRSSTKASSSSPMAPAWPPRASPVNKEEKNPSTDGELVLELVLLNQLEQRPSACARAPRLVRLASMVASRFAPAGLNQRAAVRRQRLVRGAEAGRQRVFRMPPTPHAMGNMPGETVRVVVQSDASRRRIF